MIKAEIYNDIYEFKNRSELTSFLSDNNLYLDDNDNIMSIENDGVIPAILRDWFDKRSEYKKLMQEYGNSGDTDNYIFYKQRQLIQKVLLNSIYGCLGLSRWRWYDLDNALATTSVGQTVIKFSSDMANYYYNKKLNDSKDWVIYVDTDSCFLSALPIIQKMYPEIDIDDEQAMCDKIAGVATEVQSFINNSYDVMSVRMFNIKKHRFEIKQENIARRGIWVAKKRYVQKVIWENGVTKNEIDVKGLDVKRSDFPIAFKNFMNEMLSDLLDGVDKSIVDDKLHDFTTSLSSRNILEVAKPTGVRGLKKYGQDDTLGSSKKGAPAHVKAALFYNQFLKLHALHKQVAPIKDGQKIVWIYLKNNPYGIQLIGLKGNDDHPTVVKFVEDYADFGKMFDNILLKKLEDFYHALGWGNVMNQQKKAEQFFSF